MHRPLKSERRMSRNHLARAAGAAARLADFAAALRFNGQLDLDPERLVG